jgi:hypothetical protein
MMTLTMMLLSAVAFMTWYPKLLVVADFDVTSRVSVLSRVDTLLAQPELHATLIQDGFRSSRFLNDSGVDYSSLGSLMFAQIRTISTSFYHLWAVRSHNPTPHLACMGG